MAEEREVTFADLKVEDIRGGISLDDAVENYSSKSKNVHRALRELGPTLRDEFGFRVAPQTEWAKSPSSSDLKELAERGGRFSMCSKNRRLVMMVS